MRKILRPFKKILTFIFELEAKISRAWAAGAHKRLFMSQWQLHPNPEFFDHHIDLYYQWQKNRSSFWLERGVFGMLALKRGGRTLELASGDGFNTKNFYSGIAKDVVACDFDPKAISSAKSKNSAPNVAFVVADIRTQMPDGHFDNVVWDAAIEHFKPEEITSIMNNIKKRLGTEGVLSGYTLVEKDDHVMHIEQHEYEFKDMADLRRFLTPYFKNVTVFETHHPERHNLYFWASDSVLPFSTEWPHWEK